jgi:voltage-gated potassium channel Kch
VWEYAQYPLIAFVALAAAANATTGQLLVLGYGVVVVIRRLPSRQVFGLALVILVSVPLFQALGLPGISENAAIYVYELLVIGTIRAILELNKHDLNRQI